ncbi:DUF4040 domain-containing protein [Clostridiaceae bacterium HSG29]|nr:DUF4040 domain-containing protein [Clostridiaceae bacterium HSG29]
MIKIFFHILSMIIAIYIIKTDDYLNAIITYTVFSLFSAVIYFLNYGPDVAIAEIAISSAIVPLIFIIAVSKQNEYVVIGEVFMGDSTEKEEYILQILKEFTKKNNLKLKIERDSKYLYMSGVFREVNVDLSIETLKNDKGYYFIGKDSSNLMAKMEIFVEKYKDVNVILMPDISMLRGDN